MSMKMNRGAYEKLVAEDITWLESAVPDTLERRHIVAILLASVAHEYGDETSRLKDAMVAATCRWLHSVRACAEDDELNPLVLAMEAAVDVYTAHRAKLEAAAVHP